ncbi:class I SAM-dependent methyltransferase [Variovorax paradoxus]|nr:class I SAM-dependent methyltransferase [Variovorax paradoxus]
MADRTDTWAAGDLYEPYVGRWSRQVAKELLDWLRVPPQSAWLDLGCGTGALTKTILDQAEPASVLGIDPSAGFIDHARGHITDPRASFEIGDAQGLAAAPGRFDAAVAALVLNFVPDPGLAVAGMARAVRPGGTVAAYVWDYAGKMELMRHFWDAAVALNPAAAELDEGLRFPLCQPAPLEALFIGAGLDAVDVRPLDIATPFRDFDDYWSPFLGGQGPAPGYAMSLSEADRSDLRERLRAALPSGPDGAIVLSARAWAVRGLAP